MQTVLVYSGGLDSTVLLHDLLAAGAAVRTLTVDYGQRHRREIDAARAICKARGVEQRVVDLRSLQQLFGASSLTDPSVEVPHGHYAERTMRSTIVPNRNMILLAIAGAWAISARCDSVAYAAHGGDHAIYPDCRPEFAEALERALGLADWHRLRIYRPYLGLTKGEIVARGVRLGVAFEQTWSCYEGGERHCGRCGTCVERREAFHLAGVPDPTAYAPEAPTVSELIASSWRPER